jgi:hypothetical protein
MDIDADLAGNLARHQIHSQELEQLQARIVPDPERSQIDVLQDLLDYYAALPARVPKEVDPLRYPKLAKCMGFLMILDVLDNDYCYRLYGSKIVKYSGFDMTGKKTSELPFNLPSRFFLGCYDWVRDTKRTLATQHSAPMVVNTNGWNRLILPLFEGERVVRLLVGNVNDGERRARPIVGSHRL